MKTPVNATHLQRKLKYGTSSLTLCGEKQWIWYGTNIEGPSFVKAHGFTPGVIAEDPSQATCEKCLRLKDKPKRKTMGKKENSFNEIREHLNSLLVVAINTGSARYKHELRIADKPGLSIADLTEIFRQQEAALEVQRQQFLAAIKSALGVQ